MFTMTAICGSLHEKWKSPVFHKREIPAQKHLDYSYQLQSGAYPGTSSSLQIMEVSLPGENGSFKQKNGSPKVTTNDEYSRMSTFLMEYHRDWEKLIGTNQDTNSTILTRSTYSLQRQRGKI